MSGIAFRRDEQKAVYTDYQAIDQTRGVTAGLWLHGPEAATTVRVEDGERSFPS